MLVRVYCCDQTPGPKTMFNRGWFTRSEVLSIFIKVGARQHPGRHGVEELRVLHLHLKAARRLASRQLG